MSDNLTMSKLFLILFSLFSSVASANSDAGFTQFDLLGGLASAQEDNTAGIPASASVMKLQVLTNSSTFFRGLMGFGGSVGDSINGDFNLGFTVNPFGPLGTPITPYFGASAVVLTGKFNEEIKLLYGWEVSTGINMRLLKNFALTLQFDYLNTDQAHYRYMGGFTFFFKQKN